MGNLKKLFGSNLKKLRKARNMTQEQLAEALNVSLPNISYIETGKTYPSVETQEKLCKVLKVNYPDLYMFEEMPDEKYMKAVLIKALDENPALIQKLYNFYRFAG